MILRKFGLKFASLFVALVLAYAVQRAGNASVVSLFVPIEIKNIPEDKVVVRPVRRGVQVTLKGPSFLVGPIASSPPPLRVKLPDNTEDRVMLSFQTSDISLPQAVDVISIEPAQMEFVLESVERQDVRVEIPRIGELSGGLVLEKIEVSPRLVSIKGPRSELRQIKVVETDPIDLSAITATSEHTLGLRPIGVAVTPTDKNVVARVVVREPPTERKFVDLPIELRVGSGIGALVLKPNRVTVSISGPPTGIQKISAQEVVPFVRTQGPIVGSSLVEQKVQVDLPPGFQIVDVEPDIIAIQPQEVGGQRFVAKKK